MKPKIVAASRSQVECELHENHPLRLVEAAGRRIHCVSGIAWITAYGHATDVFLRPGETYTVPNDGLVLAEAVGESRIRVDLPRVFDYSPCRVYLPASLDWLLHAMKQLPFGRKRLA
ncbi:DUF2917 domain-containing protein [Noviherbaspirillum sp.]|jgi:hypothetical protein|uniref:DUF2917 domain-containing protein n=1 Tax=Noviherbaspirillum sp. TaxID=1926288 RepID=UPI0025E0AFCE|nr:DUF2917 domain-containing protein [Noviherbaspirillum sp.]